MLIRRSSLISSPWQSAVAVGVLQVPLSRPSESIQVSDPTSISTAVGQSVHLHPCRLGSGVPCLVAPYVLDVIPDGETAFAEMSPLQSPRQKPRSEKDKERQGHPPLLSPRGSPRVVLPLGQGALGVGVPKDVINCGWY